MSATITNETILGVTANAFHIRNGNLLVQGIATTKKLFKERDASEFDNVRGNFHLAYESFTEKSVVVPDAGGDFINYSATSSRSTETVTLILPTSDEGLSDEFTNNLQTMLESITPIVNEATSDAEYLEPSNDPALFDLNGSFVYDENGASFNVTGVSIL